MSPCRHVTAANRATPARLSQDEPHLGRHSIPPGMDSRSAVEIIPGRLHWQSCSWLPTDTPDSHFFSIDDALVYEPFREDFGPLNMAMVVRFCRLLEAKLKDERYAKAQIVHCCSRDQTKRTNAACLMCAFQVIVLGRTPMAACKPFSACKPSFLPFRDAMTGPSTFALTILDCMEGIAKATELGWFSYTKFDLAEYEALCSPFGSDATWVVPGKFMAFAGPSGFGRDAHGHPAMTPEDYVPIFKKHKVGLVVRLNNKQYEKKRFTDHDIQHATLFFEDGSCPPQAIASKFIELAEAHQGGVAVHCKAGLGRTVTLMGLYVMKHLHFPARAFIGWSRIIRPGSVLGPQQQYLCDMEAEMFRMGSVSQSAPASPMNFGDGTPTATVPRSLALEDSFKEIGQGERLCAARRVHQLRKAVSLSRLTKDDVAVAKDVYTVSPVAVIKRPITPNRLTASDQRFGGMRLGPPGIVAPMANISQYHFPSAPSPFASSGIGGAELVSIRPIISCRTRRGSDPTGDNLPNRLVPAPDNTAVIMPSLARLDTTESQARRTATLTPQCQSPIAGGFLSCNAAATVASKRSSMRRQWSAPSVRPTEPVS